MAEELTRALVCREERGSPRGAAAVLEAARRRAASGGERRSSWRGGPALAVAAAVVTLLVGGGALLATRLLVSDRSPTATIPGSTTAPATTTATTTTTLLVATGDVIRLEPVAGLEPVRLSTSIGEVEFTTYAHPDGEEPPWEMTETAHGIFGSLGPDGRPAWSIDGITWRAMGPAVEPSGWPDQAVGFGDDVFVLGDGAILTTWDGAGWVLAGTLSDPRLDGARVPLVGPHGIVVVGKTSVIYRWEGAGYTAASQPPDPALHPGSSAGCAAWEDWLGWGMIKELGPVAATDDGFIALAARSEDDWHRFPVCEPLVWFSPDGNEWAPTTEESPFGAGAVVRDLAVVDGRIVAAGSITPEQAAVWVSDDGITWARSDLDSSRMLRVAGGAGGWIAVGHGDMWFSPDGSVWDGPYQRPPGWGDVWDVVGVAMLDDRIVGVGELGGAVREGSPASGLVTGVFIDE